ncbi:hypothetical protein D3C77_258490 [compost metagenome]
MAGAIHGTMPYLPAPRWALFFSGACNGTSGVCGQPGERVDPCVSTGRRRAGPAAASPDRRRGAAPGHQPGQELALCGGAPRLSGAELPHSRGWPARSAQLGAALWQRLPQLHRWGRAPLLCRLLRLRPCQRLAHGRRWPGAGAPPAHRPADGCPFGDPVDNGTGRAGAAGRLPQGGCHSPLHPGRGWSAEPPSPG